MRCLRRGVTRASRIATPAAVLSCMCCPFRPFISKTPSGLCVGGSDGFRIGARVAMPSRGIEPVAETLHRRGAQLCEDFILVLEIAVCRGLAVAHCLRDLAHGHAGDAAAGKQLLGCCDKMFPESILLLLRELFFIAWRPLDSDAVQNLLLCRSERLIA